MAGTAGSKPDIQGPSPERTVVILTGASEWPDTGLTASEAFLRSCEDFKAYFLTGFGLPQRNLLDLFDANDTSEQMLTRVMGFIERAKKQRVSDLVFYYVGHGVITDTTREFYLPIRATNPHIEVASSLGMTALAAMLGEKGRFLRQFVVLDCCFSAAAWRSFQSSPAGVAAEKVMDNLPPKGVTLLCSSGPRDPSRIPPGGTRTMFTEAMLEALSTGSPAGPDRLSFADVKHLAENLIQTKWPEQAVRPEIHSPKARHGDLRDVPFFPNAALLQRAPHRGRQSAAATPEARLHDAASAVAQALLRPAGGPDRAVRTRTVPEDAGVIDIYVLCLHRTDVLEILNGLIRVIQDDDPFGAGIFARAKYELVGVLADGSRTPLTEGARTSASQQGRRTRYGTMDAAPGIAAPVGLVARLQLAGSPDGVSLEARIHIRTVLDDLLLEVDRELRDAAAADDRVARMFAQAEVFLGPLRQLLSGCAGYVEAIRKEIHDAAAGELEEGRPSPSMLSPDRTGMALADAQVPTRLVSEIVEILRMRDEAENAGAAPGASTRLLAIAERLKQIHERESAANGYLALAHRGCAAYRYSLRMEEALSRVGTGVREQLAMAVSIYEELAGPFDRNAAVRYRLGWVLGKLGNPAAAIDRYREAQRLIKEADRQTAAARAKAMNTDELGLMSRRLPRLIGFQHWKISRERERENDPAQQLEALAAAYRDTEPALSVADPKEMLTRHNNMLYYVVEYLSVAARAGLAGDALASANLEPHLRYVESNVDVATHEDDDQLDTLCFAYDHIGEGDKAVAAARRVLELLIGTPGSGSAAVAATLDETKVDTLRRAYRVIQKYGQA